MSKGVYICAHCQQQNGQQHPVYSSDDQVEGVNLADSTVFHQALSTTAITVRQDYSFGLKRAEVVCSKCGAHLGHLFQDAGALERHTIANKALQFMPVGSVQIKQAATTKESHLPTTQSNPAGTALVLGTFAAGIGAIIGLSLLKN